MQPMDPTKKPTQAHYSSINEVVGMHIIHAFHFRICITASFLVIFLFAEQDEAQNDHADGDAHDYARAYQNIDHVLTRCRCVARDNHRQLYANAAITAVECTRRDIASHLTEPVTEEGGAINRTQGVVMIWILRRFDCAIRRWRWNVTKFKANARLHRIAPWMRLLASGIATVVVPTKAVMRMVEMCARMLIRRLVGPVLASVSTDRRAPHATVVGAIRLFVTLVSAVVTVCTVPSAPLVVAHLVAFVVVDPRWKASIGTA